jgi:hypothetical protein
MRDFVLSFALMLFFSLPPVAVALWPRDDAAVVVLATPDVAAVVGEAGGVLLALGDDGTSASTRSDGSTADFRARLVAAGARLLLAAPDDLACLATPSPSTTSLTKRSHR